MKKLLIALILCLPIVGFAQDSIPKPNYNSIHLNWGAANLQIQNITASPMIHESWSAVNVVLRYDRAKKLDHQIYFKFSQHKDQVGEEFQYTAIYLDDIFYPTLPHEFLLIDLNYSLGKQLLKSPDWKFTVGGRSSNSFNQSYYDLGPAGSGVYYFSLGLDVWFNAKYDLGEKHHFVANLALPVFSWVSRSPYLSTDGRFIADNATHKDGDSFINYLKRGKIHSWNKRQAVNFDLSYYYSLTDKWQLGAAYWLSMNFNQDPQRYGAIENIIQLSGKFNF